MAPIASDDGHPADCGLRIAKQDMGGVADTKLSKFEIAAAAFGGLAMTNERARDLCQFGAYTDSV